MKTDFPAILFALFVCLFVSACSQKNNRLSRGAAAGAAIRELGAHNGQDFVDDSVRIKTESD